MTPEFNPIDPALEQAVSAIHSEVPSDAVVEAAAARVWARLAVETHAAPAEHIRSCADFQALLPDYRAGRLSAARATLLKDHLHQCVACRRVAEGRVVAMPAPSAARSNRSSQTMKWAVAAVVLLAAGTTVVITLNQKGGGPSRAMVASVTGNVGKIYAVSADGLRLLAVNQDLPLNVELRTAADSDAVLQLSDGSLVEMRERSSLSTTAAGTDTTIHLGRGSVIVQAAHRRTGHLYVDTSDCRVAVTGTVFGVTSGVKGSRVSVVQGEVHMTQDNTEKVLHAGDQAVTSPSVEPGAVTEDIGWSRNQAVLKQLNELRNSLQQVHMPALRYSSTLLDRLPSTVRLYVSLPNLSQYLADAESVLGKKMGASPQLRAWWNGPGSRVGEVIDLVRAGSDYLGDEIDVVNAKYAPGPVVLAEQRKPGFEEFLQKKGVKLAFVMQNNVLVFGPDRAAVEAVAGHLDGSFKSAPLYAKIETSYHAGAGLLIAADLSEEETPLPGVRYFMAEQKQTENHEPMASAALGFDGPRTGIAGALAAPSAMGSLDYISPDTTAVAAFVLTSPGALVDSVMSLQHGSFAAAQKALAEDQQSVGFDIRSELASSLGGEFSFAMDGPILPVPSWKLIAEVYDPARFQATVQKFVEAHNRDIARSGEREIKTAQESFEGRTYYSISLVNAGPLLEAHYTFDQGYLVAGPTRALVQKSLQLRTAGTSIKHSERFLSLTPRDHYVNFSALIYQNLGTSLAPLAMLAGAFANQGGHGDRGNAFSALNDIKPNLYAVYAEPDRIAMATKGDVLASSLTSLMSGNILGLTGIQFPMGQFMGTQMHRTPYPVK